MWGDVSCGDTTGVSDIEEQGRMNRAGENVIIKAESETCKVAPLARLASTA
jgi:hypothetical protein